jgi:PAS domain S-box-containing protein
MIDQQRDMSPVTEPRDGIRHEHAQMESLIASLTAGTFFVDLNGSITEYNLALENLIALDKNQLINQPYHRLFSHLITLSSESELVQQSLSSALLNVADRPSVEFTVEEQGKVRHLELTFFPIRAEGGSPLGWGGLVQDITDLRQQLAWKLELLTILAHDLRTPLATLKGHATALLANFNQWGTDMVIEFLEAIDRGIDQLVNQVDRNLALTRVETGRLGLRPEAVKPTKLVDQALERAGGILDTFTIERHIPEGAPLVRADPARAEEVLVNLLENAARYNPPQEPIKVSMDAEQNWVKIAVTDSGPGIPREEQSRIFQKYAKRGDSPSGTGLGLFISRKIIEAHGGKIWVESPPEGQDTGSKFVLTLPIMPTQAMPQTKTINGLSVENNLDNQGSRTLVIEDEADYQALLHTILTDQGYQVEIAPDGLTALSIAQASPPDIILLDWMLPGMDGLNVCRNIRRWSNVPIIVVTSKTSQEDLIAALEAGADDYVVKPFRGGELLARMGALIRRGDRWDEAKDPSRFQAGGLMIDYPSKEAWLNGNRLDLTPTEYDLLAYMAHHKGQVITHDQLIAHLWNTQEKGSRRGLFVHISRLRKKIERDPDNPKFILTRWRVGYIFMPDKKSPVTK